MGGSRRAESSWAIPEKVEDGPTFWPTGFLHSLLGNFEMRSRESMYKAIPYSTICDTYIRETTAYQLGFIHAMGYYT